MKKQALLTIISWFIFPSLAMAADPSTLKSSDLLSLKKAMHNATPAQLEQRYQAYADQMAAYLADLPSCLDIWMNLNEVKRKKLQTAEIFSPAMIDEKANKCMAEHITGASAARQNLIKITSVAAIKQIDEKHHWDLPTGVSQIKPAAGVTDVKDLSPQIKRQLPQ